MVKIDAIVRQEKIEEVKDALQEIKIHGMTISQVVGCGTSMGYTQLIRASKVDVNVLPKVKFEIVVSDNEWAEATVKAISEAAYTGEHGDGKIFVYALTDVVRIRTGERGPEAVWDSEQKKAPQKSL